VSADGISETGDGPLPADDLVQSFRVESEEKIGGRIVRLGNAVDQILIQHEYPLAVSQLVGEAVVLVALMGGGMKFEGRLTLQSRGSGPVSMIVADYMSNGEVRAYAGFDEARLAALPRGASVGELLGDGTLAITLDRGSATDLYQGIVALEGETLADCARDYLHRSEQVESFLKLAVAQVIDKDGKESWRAGGLMIQHMPKLGTTLPDEEAEPFRRTPDDPWNRAQILAATVETHELTDPRLSTEEVLLRLFHEDGVRVSPPQPLSFGCTCSEQRVRRLLAQYTDEDYKTMLEDGMIRVRCEFCSRTYRFLPESLIRS
jgi:molecular chaperone Hsp33